MLAAAATTNNPSNSLSASGSDCGAIQMLVLGGATAGGAPLRAGRRSGTGSHCGTYARRQTIASPISTEPDALLKAPITFVGIETVFIKSSGLNTREVAGLFQGILGC